VTINTTHSAYSPTAVHNIQLQLLTLDTTYLTDNIAPLFSSTNYCVSKDFSL